MSRYPRTRLATDWPEEGRQTGPLGRFLRRLLPDSNPTYEPVMHLVDEWLIEFPDDDETKPWREIGLNPDGVPVLAGPTDRDYGFWLDTNLERWDFADAQEIPEQLFENLWSRFFADHPDLNPID